MAKVPDIDFEFSIPASEAMRAGWTLFWMGVKARVRRRPWWAASVSMKVGTEQKAVVQ